MNLPQALDTIDNEYGAPMSVFADMLRAMICAAPNHTLISADYSNIEGRVLAWLAGEQWKVAVFKDYDTVLGKDAKGEPIRKGRDPYLLGAERILTLLGRPPAEPPTKKSPERQGYGKVPELACGFGGGVGAFQSMARIYGVKMTDAEADQVKTVWREAHPKIKAFWYRLEDAAIGAVQNPGSVTKAGKILFRMAGSFLWARLPSGRSLCYPYPTIKDKLAPWKDKDGNDVYKPALHFMGVDPLTKQWCEQNTYGGSLAENVTQAVARDILANGMKNVEAAGYPVVMHVHDEIVSEVPEGFGSVAEYESLMCRLPKWADGLPVVAEGWAGARYRK